MFLPEIGTLHNTESKVVISILKRSKTKKKN